MTFEGEEIGLKPTMSQLEIYIADKGVYITPQQVWDFWEKKNWLTKKGVPVKTLEAAVSVANGVLIQKEFYHGTRIKGQSKVERRKEKEKIIKETQQKAKEIYDKNCQKRPYSKYEEQLKDDRWNAFRNFVFNVRGRKCEICGSYNILQVHHLQYKPNCKAWEYTCNDVIVVCQNCHKKLHGVQ